MRPAQLGQLAALLAAVLLAGCGGSDAPPPRAPAADSTASGTTAPSPAPAPPQGTTGPVTLPLPSTFDSCLRVTRKTVRGLRLVGRSESAGETTLARKDLTRRDGKDLPINMDLRCNRVNVAVEDGRVIHVLKPG